MARNIFRRYPEPEPEPKPELEPAPPQPGTQWDGPVAYCMDAPADVPVHGYYALNDDGKGFRQPLLRLVCVDDAPGDPDDGAHHFVIAGAKDPSQVAAGRIVELEAHTTGQTGAFA